MSWDRWQHSTPNCLASSACSRLVTVPRRDSCGDALPQPPRKAPSTYAGWRLPRLGDDHTGANRVVRRVDTYVVIPHQSHSHAQARRRRDQKEKPSASPLIVKSERSSELVSVASATSHSATVLCRTSSTKRQSRYLTAARREAATEDLPNRPAPSQIDPSSACRPLSTLRKEPRNRSPSRTPAVH